MKWQLLALALLLGFFRSANSADTPEPVAVDGICGKLVSVDASSAAGGNEFVEARSQTT